MSVQKFKSFEEADDHKMNAILNAALKQSEVSNAKVNEK